MKKINKTLAAIIALSALTQACDPVPLLPLTQAQKEGDLHWIFAQFDENYAPMDYKTAKWGVDVAAAEKQALADAAATTTNEEFYDVMFNFISKFKDAHTAGSLSNSSREGRAKIAYLGFGGKRRGNNLMVTKILPTITSDSNFPIQKGDLITKIDGVDLPTVVKTDLAKYRDLGRDESNLTYHMNKIFTRVSTANGQPKNKNATLTVNRSGTEFTVDLPWVVKDLVAFSDEQEKASGDSAKANNMARGKLAVSDDKGVLFNLNTVGFDGRLFNPETIMNLIKGDNMKRFIEGFRFVDGIESWVADRSEVVRGATIRDRIREIRTIPSTASIVAGSEIYPAYTFTEETPAGKKQVGYILLDTFSPDEGDEAALAEIKATLSDFNNRGVKDIVIDLLNNGGGSLMLSSQIAQALKKTKINLPQIQYRLSSKWVERFEQLKEGAASDANRELARRVYDAMMEDRKAGVRLSKVERKFTIDTLSPYLLQASDAIAAEADDKTEFNIVLMVNEMCASSCDIFAALIKDNNMGKLVGTNTMGAGGNVVSYDQAPASHLTLRQTESLIVRPDGSYLENNGVAPDVEFAVNEDAHKKYDTVRKKAVEVLLNGGAAAPAGPGFSPDTLKLLQRLVDGK